jgi:ribosomal silencing factor RsfS
MKECMGKDFPQSVVVCCQFITDKKYADPGVFDIRDVSGIADYILLVIYTSEAHLKTIGSEFYQRFKHRREQWCRVDCQLLSGLLVFNAFDVVLHMFQESMCPKYDLDKPFVPSDLLDFKSILSFDMCEKI